MQTVLVNAGPLIALGKLNRLHLLLDLYGIVHVPRAVYREVVDGGIAYGAPDARTVRLFLERASCPIVAAFRASFLSRLEAERLILEIGARPDIWISEALCRSVVEQLA